LICAACHRTTGNTNAKSEPQTRFKIIIEKGDDRFRSPFPGTALKLFSNKQRRFHTTGYRGTQFHPQIPTQTIINIHRHMRLEYHSQNQSEIPRLTRAQRLNCLRVQREFFQEIIDNKDLGPCLERAFFFDSSDPTPSVDFADDLINESHIILKLVFRLFGDLYAYRVFFHNGETKWEEIEITSNYWQQE
jgi:hypothetical protein